MAEIINNTIHSLTFHKGKENWKIPPFNSREIPDNAWAKMKKNSRVKGLIEAKDIHVLNEPVSLLSKIKNFFY